MSQYSELMGSFLRTGNFPLEANYIFATEEALKEFYSDPINATTLHKGLLRVVENGEDGEQALYWVVKKETNDELEFRKLISLSTSDDIQTKLEELQKQLEREIYERKAADDAIYGSSDHTVVPEDLNNLYKIATAIQELVDNCSTLKEELKATVGTEEDDIRTYLQTLSYKSLTEVSEALNTFLNTVDPEDESINTWVELKNFLEGYKDSEVLKNVLSDLYDSILGDPVPTEPFRTLRGIEDFVRTFKSESENTDANLQTELDQTQVGVGLSGDGAYNADQETYYLKDATSVMNALKILDSLINEAINNCNIQVEDTNTVDLTLQKSPTETLLSADIKISTEQGNGILTKSDGLFYKLTTEYSDGVLTVKVNDNIISQHDLGLSTIVSEANYDPTQEAIIIVFELHNGKQQTITIPVGALIREWTVDNSDQTKVVELTKEEVLGSGPDKLSADIRLYVDKYQILVKEGNALYVKGTTDNLAHNNQKLSDVLDQMQSSSNDLSEKLDQEIERATEADKVNAEAIQNEINRAQAVETELTTNLNNHISNLDNPHQVTKEQVGLGNVTNDAQVKKDEMGQPGGVATLDDNGKIPVNQIPGQIDEVVGIDHFVTTKDEIPSHLTVGDKYYVEEESKIFTAITDSTLDEGITPEKGILYSNRDLNTIYRWDGKELIEVGNPIHLGETTGTAYPGDKGKLLYDTLISHLEDFDNPHKVTKDQVGLDQVDNTADIDKPVSAAQQQAIDTAKTEVIDLINQSNNALKDHINNHENPHQVTKDQVGLGKVENLSPLEMPISQETQNALNTKADTNYVNQQLDTKAPIDSPVFKGIPQVENAPELGDNSNRIPTTNWVVTTVENSVGQDLTDHINDFNNPHRVTAEQVNAFTKEEVQSLLDGKADLVDGKIPEELLPEDVSNSVHYNGEWDASTNSPQLQPAQPELNGVYYIVTSSGSFNGQEYDPGDIILNAGGQWIKIDNTEKVTSVNGQTGEIQLGIEDIPGLQEAIDEGGSGLEAHITDYNNPHRVTKDQVGLGNVENYSPAEMPISDAVREEINRIDTTLSETGTDLSYHIRDYNNPHKVTKAQIGLDKVDNTSDLEKPISVAMQEALNEIKLDATGYATKNELNDHINDRMNPHFVTKDQVGLGNVDNTSDLDKPISNAVQRALDNKADYHHTHTMADITDLETLPIIKGFVEVLSELPEQAVGGDKYIMATKVGSGATRYTLLEFDGSNSTWKQKLLTTGGIACVIGEEVWKLTSEGIQRVLDSDDYKYFYDKMWTETKDLVQSIEWDESTDTVIRLKVTTKKSYAAPNTDEATQPTVTPTVSYINIEKERFMSNAYSRPATQEDVNQGYASKVGVPVLVVELTTGDEVVIDLTDTMNIYDPVTTSSINMQVSDWTGDASTSYKISANVRIAENSDAVKIVDSGNNGIYARLDKANTNSIQLVDNGSLSANLVIDNATNNASDIALSIGAAGLSAKFVWGEYE